MDVYKLEDLIWEFKGFNLFIPHQTPTTTNLIPPKKSSYKGGGGGGTPK